MNLEQMNNPNVTHQATLQFLYFISVSRKLPQAMFKLIPFLLILLMVCRKGNYFSNEEIDELIGFPAEYYKTNSFSRELPNKRTFKVTMKVYLGNIRIYILLISHLYSHKDSLSTSKGRLAEKLQKKSKIQTSP